MGRLLAVGCSTVVATALGCADPRLEREAASGGELDEAAGSLAATPDWTALSASARAAYAPFEAATAAPKPAPLPLERGVGGTVRPVAPAAALAVELPSRADGRFSLRDARSGMTASFVLEGATSSVVEVGEAHARYPGALAGADVLVRASERGVEDHLHFASAPAVERATYRVDVRAAAGLRLVGNTLELVDAAGTPRLRVAPPYVLDREGATRRAELAVEGCAVDTSPQAPWGRAPTAPGAGECRLVVAWGAAVGDASLSYPAVVDPLWTTTGDMVVPRTAGGRDRIDGTSTNSGRVLVAGGLGAGVVLAAAELYDPATATWGATADMPAPRYAASLRFSDDGGSGRAHFLGGCTVVDADPQVCKPSAATFQWDPDTGAWGTGPSLVEPGCVAPTVQLLDGRILAAGGCIVDQLTTTATAQIYDWKADAWTATAPMSKPRFGHAMARLADGRVFVAGGLNDWNGGAIVEDDAAEIFDPSAGSWTSAGVMSTVRRGPVATTLPDGRVALIGGLAGINWVQDLDIYDPATDAWSLGSPLVPGRRQHAQALLASGVVVVAGGCCDDVNFEAMADAQMYDPATDTWSAAEGLPGPRMSGATVPLADGRVLVAGGLQQPTGPGWPDAIVLDLGAGGIACTTDVECASGHCADGVCCNEACDGACQACSTAAGASADGTCEPVADGEADPHGICEVTMPDTCGQTGACDGQGSCRVVASGEGCGPCPDGAVGSCDGAGQCVCAVDHCLDSHTVVKADGTAVDCAPYLCVADACATTCNTSTECVAPALCDENHACVADDTGPGPSGLGNTDPIASGSATDEGCGCRQAGAPVPSSSGAVALLGALGALGALATRRRRMGGARSRPRWVAVGRR